MRITQPASRNNNLRILVLILVGAALVVFCWWYFFVNKPVNTSVIEKTGAVEQNSPAQPQSPQAVANIFKIPELGIQLTLPEGLEDLEYRVIEGNGGSDVIRHVTFITKSLMDLDKQKSGNNGGYCTAERGVIGGIILYKNSHHDEGGYANTTKVKSGHAGYMGTQSGCSGSEEVVNLQLQQASLLREASKTITTIE